ncbi:MAG: hypothetical protein Q4D96_04845 [Propionibacteriaceae bacterium]|nr:hypothetical protein [Propionibacteriaceae bacterium]
MVHTVHAVYVERVLQGTALPRTTVEVGELGGVHQGTRYTTPTGILLEQRKSYVLFLEVHDDHPASFLNPVQSVYEREGDTLRPLPGNTLPAAEVGELG